MEKQAIEGDTIFVVKGLLTPEECVEYVRVSEQQGYGVAPITMGDGAIVVKEYRDNLRVMTDDKAMAERLFARVRPFLPDPLDSMRLVGLNERLRFYRYDAGHHFAPHFDGAYQRSVSEQSRLTFMVYLSDDCEGGTTDFYDAGERLQHRIQPQTGMALIFRHELLHGGASVTSGRKYVLRSDVMYAFGRHNPVRSLLHKSGQE